MTAARQPRSERSAMIAKLHIAKKQLGLDDGLYRDTLEAATGRRSAKDMTEAELSRALRHFQQRGFNASSKPPSKGGEKGFADSVYLPKVRALWLSGWHLGIVRDRSDGAMAAFIKRQTGIESSRWLTRAEDARVVVEALKSWFAREADVDWSQSDNPRRCVVEAQFRRLVALGAFKPYLAELHRSDIEGYGWRVTGKAAFGFYEPADWDKLIRVAGAKLRGALARQAERTG
ncbi:MAG: regulatory protein GemA [Gammaproteobacteria bacterium]